MIPDRSPTRRTPRTLLALALVALAAVAAALPLALGAAPAQSTSLFLPDLQAGEKSFLFAHGEAVRPQDQEGFGDSEVEVQNRAQMANSVELVLEPKSGTQRASLKRSLGARQAVRLQTRAESVIDAGYFSGQLLGSQPLGAIARVRWVSGANSAYEAVPAAKTLILPLIARTVYSHTSYLFVQNADAGPARNEIEMTIFDNQEGAILKQVTVDAEPGETAGWDTAFDQLVFGPDVLPSNAPTGGWLGHAWFSAEAPVAALGYGDELNGRGSSAYVGRSMADADLTQHLPLVRANYQGDSLIAVANAGHGTIDVTIEYRGADFSPSGGGQTFSQAFQITPRGSRFVDLSTRGRGTVPQPGLPRGGRADQGFIGSAVVRASGPVLAVVQDEQLKAGQVDSVSAYNAFGAADMGSAFGAPAVRKAVEYLSTTLLLYNPGAAPLPVAVQILSPENQPRAQLDFLVPAGGLSRASLAETGLANGLYRVEMDGNGPFAALLFEERDLSEDPAGSKHTIKVRDLADWGVSGSADLIEKGADMEVVIELRGSSAGPGTTLKAAIRKGVCGLAFEVRDELNDVRDGKSTTLVRSTSIDALTLTPHALVIQRPGANLPPQDVACGFIEEIHTGETTDTMLAWAVKLRDGGSLVTPSTPTATATEAPPTLTPATTASATPTDSGPSPGTPTPPPPTATTSGPGLEVRIHLPFAYK